MMVKIGFEDVGKYDKATFVCLQHSFPYKFDEL